MSTVVPTTTFDPAAFKTTTRAQWQAAAEAWHRWGPFLGQWLGAATETMFEMARIGPGARVLDVAAGAGEQSIAAARRVGPAGTCWPPTSRRRCSNVPRPMRMPRA